MPVMNVDDFKRRIESHLHVVKKMCKKSKKFYWGISQNSIFNDVFDLVIPNYFLSTFSPTKGYYILTCPEKTSKQLRKFFDHIFKCEKCLKTKEHK